MILSLFKSEKRIIQKIMKTVYPEYKAVIKDRTLWNSLIGILTKNKIIITSAESCTGGLFAAHLTDCPGASKCFSSSFVTYSDNSKRKLLNVKEEIINKYGAVSVECAQEMAEGALKITESELAVSITGIAGPGGGTELKPIGTVCFCVAGLGINSVKKYLFKGNRQMIRTQAVYYALAILLKGLHNYA